MAQWSLLETWIGVNIQRLTRALHCAHVVWPDLAQIDAPKPSCGPWLTTLKIGIYIKPFMKKIFAVLS